VNGSSDFGGGVHCDGSSPTIRGNVIRDCFAEFSGGGIRCRDSAASILDNVVESNHALNGGGIFCRNPLPVVISGNAILENTAESRSGGIGSNYGPALVVTGNTFTDNVSAWTGGAIDVRFVGFEGGLEFTGNTVADNRAEVDGGGLHTEDGPVSILDNVFLRNVAVTGDGGAMHTSSGSGTIARNDIRANRAIAGRGGGLFGVASPEWTVEDNRFVANTAGHGGAIADYFGGLLLDRNIIALNTSSGSGGGVFLQSSTLRSRNDLYSGNVASQSGGGFACDGNSSPRVLHASMYANRADGEGGAMSFEAGSNAIINSTIVWGNAAPVDPSIHGPSFVSHSDVEAPAIWPGIDNINQNPLWVDPEGGDFHLRLGSPCIDAGRNDAPYLPADDFENDARKRDGDLDGIAVVDMGADELVVHVAAAFGTVNAGVGPLADVLFLNGSAGDRRRVVSAATGESLELAMEAPPAGPMPAPFALYAWLGHPDDTNVTPQPKNLGATCFPTFLTGGAPLPLEVWNNLGFEGLLGNPDFPSTPAPSIVFSVANGRPNPIDITFQGLVLDDGSAATKPGSVTNAILLTVE
jgi:hypothetical protein